MYFSDPGDLELAAFKKTTALMDWVVAITCEAWHWVLPSNRFSLEPGPSFTNLVGARDSLNAFREGTLTTKACGEDLITKVLPRRLLDQGEGARSEVAVGRLITSMLRLLAGSGSARIAVTDRYKKDGGGSGKGFCVMAVEDIPIATTLPDIFGHLIAIPEEHQVNFYAPARAEIAYNLLQP